MPPKWFRLDTAGLIFPPTMNRKWCNAFRLSAVLDEEIDPTVLEQAVRDLKPRFPTFYVRLKAGLFWFRLEESIGYPHVTEDYAFPLSHMTGRELKQNCLRVFYFRDRIAVEFFHSITDGTGGTVYFKNLICRYLFLRYGTSVPTGCGILDPEDDPSEEELEDSFFRNSYGHPAPRSEESVYRLTGTEEPLRFRHLITGSMPTDVLKQKASEYSCSVTAFLSGVMLQALIVLQEQQKTRRRFKPVKVCIPVNLRSLYGSSTLRNFVLTLNLGVDPRNGSYTLQELCDSVKFQLKSRATPQFMAGPIASNTLPQKNLFVRAMPLPVKNLVMNAVYHLYGERTGCINISNLGTVDLPPAATSRVRRFDFIIGVQKTYPNNCSVASYGGVTRINMIRSIRESELERLFFSSLVELGIPVDIESN